MSDDRKGAAGRPFVLVTVFLDTLAIGLIVPVLPILVGQFTAGPDQQALWFGILSALFGVMQFFCTPIQGALSDRFGRRPILLLSNLGMGLSWLVHALATTLLPLLLVRIVSGATAASFSVANAYMADITPPEGRGKAFGLIGAAFGLGFIFGPMLGGLLGNQDIRLPFFVAAGLALLNALYGYFVLPESLPADRRAPFAWRRANPFSALAHLGRLQSIGGLLGVFALSVFAQMMLQTTWVLYTTFRFGWTPSANGLALFVVGMVQASVQGLLQGRLLSFLGERRLALLGLASPVIAFTLYGAISQGGWMYAVILGNFLSFAAAPTLQAIVSKAVGPSEQGVTQGALTAISSLAIVFAPLVGTSILGWVSHLSPQDWRMGASFYLCALLQAGALFLAWRHFRRQPTVTL